MTTRSFQNFSEFYPFYLGEHSNKVSRILHFIGTWLVLLTFLSAMVLQVYVLLWALPILGYGFAWVGHFFFEKNKPATFQHPIYSLMGDWVMWWELNTGKIRF